MEPCGIKVQELIIVTGAEPCGMNEKELIMEAYMGYFIGAITVIFLSILIFGYVKTTEIPACMCHNGTDSAYDDICLGWFPN